MSFSLSVYGHISDSQREKDLASQIGNLLRGYGTDISSASFSGSSFGGDPRALVDELASNGDPALHGASEPATDEPEQPEITDSYNRSLANEADEADEPEEVDSEEEPADEEDE